MNDTTVTTEAPLPNSTEARSTTGEILDQSTTQTTASTDQTQAQTTDKSATTETKDGTTTLTKPTDKGEAKTEGAPEKYTDFKAPEGYTLDPKSLEAATPIFKDLNLTQDQAQRLVDFHTKAMIDAAAGPQAAYETMRTDWRNQVQADPDIKASGIDTVKTDIGRALNALGDAKLVNDFKAAMDLTGAGDHPAFVKAMWRLSQFITEGKHVAGGGPSKLGQKTPGSSDRPSAAKSLYPTLP